jgi:hypothetical protein
MKRIILALVTVAAVGGDAAAVPASFSFTGRLADDGVPVDGSVTLGLELYDVAGGGSALWSESHATTADNGLVSVAMGGQAALDPADFGGGDLWLAVTVEGQVMTPRLQIRSVPYALRAEVCDDAEAIGGIPAAEVQQVLDSNCAVGSAIRDISPAGVVTCEPVGGVPSGAIAFYTGACPTGWSEYTALRGRVPLGLPTSASTGTTQGTALTNVVTTRTITTVPPHTHMVDPASFQTPVGEGTHTHGASASTNGSHDHPLDLGNGGYGTSRVQGSSSASQDVTDLPVDNDGEHSHTITVNSTNSGHVHNVDVPETETTNTGDNVAGAAVDVTMPYILLRACQKN